MKNRIKTRNIALTALLLAIEVVFQIIGNFIYIGPVNINLTLIPITIGAILLGPYVGAFLGFVNGILVICAPSTIGLFMPISTFGTIITCLLKSTFAGLIVGYVYKIFKTRRPILGSILASTLTPIINTGLFICGCLVFFMDFLNSGVNEVYTNPYSYLFLAVISWNFIFEFGISLVLCPTIIKVIHIYKEKKN